MLRTQTSLLAVTLTVALGSIASASPNGPTKTGPGTEIEPTVVGGQPAPAGKWPDVAALIASEGYAVCTGTLIAPNVVLTAGHCVDGITIDSVKLNAIDSESGPGEVIAVAEATAYPNWEGTMDVAVLVLEEASTITPRAVATDCMVGTALVDNAPVTLVGYGATTPAGNDYNTTLMEGNAVIEDAACQPGDGCNEAVSPGGEFVAGGEADSCYGDSGGPVYLASPNGTVVAGVVSRGTNSAGDQCGLSGIYVRPDGVIEWIESTAGTTISKATCGTPPDDGGDDTGDGDGDGDGDGSGDGDGDGTGDGSGGEGEVHPVIGGCSAGGGSGGAAPGALLLLALVLIRRRRDG